MQTLFTLILIAGACWMAWGTWSVLRPNSSLFSKETYNSRVDKRNYSAFIGFWFTLVLVIFFPTYWLLNLILPEHWGSHNADNGEWRSYAETIAGLVAAAGSFGLIAKMEQTGLSVSQIDFWTSRFQPKEVAQCLTALEKVKPLFARVLCANSVLKRVESEIVSADGREALLRSIRVTENKPRDVVLLIIVNVSTSLLASGQFHVYRGALNGEGSGIQSAFNIALQELIKSEFINEVQATEQRSVVAEAIKEVG